MEEILASIRRIISEDGPGAEAGRPSAARAANEAAAVEPLDLTELVEDPGPPALEPLDLTELEEPPAKPPAPMPAGRPPQGQAQPAATATRAVPVNVPPANDAPVDAPAPAAAPPVATPEVVRRAAPAPTVTPPPEPQPRPKAAPPATPAVAAPEAPKPAPEPELVGGKSQEQAAAALGDMVRAIRQDKQQRAQPGPRSPLENLVLEALRPSLKAWLDQNLAPLVERVVREEVRRLARRVEDQ